jgi:hypothetical protein
MLYNEVRIARTVQCSAVGSAGGVVLSEDASVQSDSDLCTVVTKLYTRGAINSIIKSKTPSFNSWDSGHVTMLLLL